VFLYVFNRELDRLESGYIRNRQWGKIDETLLDFLNECFPVSEHTVHDFFESPWKVEVR